MPSTAELIAALWPKSNELRMWTIFDGARDRRIYRALERSYLQQSCLFAGKLSPALRAASPYLVRLDLDDRLTPWLLENRWGNSWGVFLQSTAALDTLQRHFRTFLRVKSYEGKYLLFRYYGPRVLRVYLPTCTADELSVVFGPVKTFLLEEQDAAKISRNQFAGRKLISTLDEINKS